MKTETHLKPEPSEKQTDSHFRFIKQYHHLRSVFGNDWFALKAEAFARFFGTPTFLITQTTIVAAWIILNLVGVFQFDLYPFILLNLAFSLQAAYAAPLILLAQTRQADRDKAMAQADALHREALAQENNERQDLIQQASNQISALLQQNTALTEITHTLTIRIDRLTAEMHDVLSSGAKPD